VSTKQTRERERERERERRGGEKKEEEGRNKFEPSNVNCKEKPLWSV
jgi:hypothetical protein